MQNTNPLQDAQNNLVLFDSLTGKKQPFQPIKAGEVNMYVCGMTVYDYCHIGHARVIIGFDVISRWLREIGFKVNYVRNITDIDDKIIQRANENGESIEQLTTRFIKAMHEDSAALGCMSPDLEPKATDYIDEMQEMIATLVEKDHAYQTNTDTTEGLQGDVFYAVDSFADYGKLSKRVLEDMQAGQRVAVDSDKKNPFDFVLWKAAKAGEPFWPSPWGNGRPGWHIECSAMSTNCLGDTFDIHGGGHDLQFPHHENEIAQSEACTGCTYANNWMHLGFINVDGEKMSKSLGNFFTIRDVLEKFHPETIRYFILSSHYRSQVNFSDTALKESHTALSRLYQTLKAAEYTTGTDVELMDESVYQTQFGQDFIKAMNDDFNVVSAISVLFAVAKEVNVAIEKYKSSQDAEITTQITQTASILKTLAKVFNILQEDADNFLKSVIGDDEQGLNAETIDALIKERNQAKLDKNYARADEIRQKLLAQGVELADSRDGTTWRRV